MYIANGQVAIVSSNFTDNHIGNEYNDINAIPTITIINSTFHSGSKAVDGNTQACKPFLCQDTIVSYPQYGIDCKDTSYGVRCYRCHPGKFLNDTYASCLPCLPGTFTSNYGSASCKACSPGNIAPTKGATECKLCGLGKYSNNHITCIDVPPGMYPSNCSDTISKKGCSLIKPCPRGFFCPRNTAKPYPCEPGYYSNITGAPMCLKCNSGRASNASQATECKTCAKGQFGRHNGATGCDICSSGQYSNFKGLPTCLQCSPGQAVNSKNSTRCLSCEIGKFMNRSGSAHCDVCPPGTTTYVAGSVQCSNCQKGKVGGENGHCKDCPPGKHSPKDGMTDCIACNVGLHPDANSISCIAMAVYGEPPTITSVQMGVDDTTLFVQWKLPTTTSMDDTISIVPVNRITNEDVFESVWHGSAHAFNATLLNLDVVRQVYTVKVSIQHATDKASSPNATYSTRWKTTSDCSTDSKFLNSSGANLQHWKCTDCPIGASCQGPITWSGVQAKFGNWYVPNTTIFTKCLRPQSCLGAANNLYNARFPILARNDQNVSCARPAFKQNVRKNRLCATCARPHYARGSANGSCERCDVPLNLIFLICSIIFGLIAFTVLLRMTLFQRRRLKLSDGIKKISINYLQFASLALHLNMPWTNVLRELFKWQSYGVGISNALLSLDCVLADTHTTYEVFKLKFFSMFSRYIQFIRTYYYNTYISY